MLNTVARRRMVATVALLAMSSAASAQTRVTYGRITSVSLVTQQSADAQAGGAILGGMVGLASSANRSGGTAALRGVGGALAGQQIGRLASQRQAFRYTILVADTSTVTMVTDEAGLRVGDCVAVERGTTNNLRLVADARCEPAPRPAASAPTPPPATAPEATSAEALAEACGTAKDRLFDAKTDTEFERAYRTVRLLCVD